MSRLATRRRPWSPLGAGAVRLSARAWRRGTGGGGARSSPVGLPSPASGTHRQAKGAGVVRAIRVPAQAAL